VDTAIVIDENNRYLLRQPDIPEPSPKSQEPTAAGEVIITSFNWGGAAAGLRDSFKRRVKTILLPALKPHIRKVNIRNQAGVVRTLAQNAQIPKFDIHLWGIPISLTDLSTEKAMHVEPHKSIMGVMYQKQGMQILPKLDIYGNKQNAEKNTHLIIDADNEAIIAQVTLDLNHLFIYPNFTNFKEGAVEIFEKILEQTAKILTTNLPREDVLTSKAFEEKRLFYQHIQRKLGEEKRKADQELQSASRQVRSYGQNLATAVKNERHALIKVEGLGVVGAKKKESDIIYESLQNIRQVKRYTFTVTGITAHTDILYCEYEKGDVREIGAMEIFIPYNYVSNAIKWKNKTRNVRAFDSRLCPAPHVIGGDGSACLGNSNEVFAHLIAKMDLVAAVTRAIKFVETVNLSDPAGRMIVKWPKVGTDGTTDPITGEMYPIAPKPIIPVTKPKKRAKKQTSTTVTILTPEPVTVRDVTTLTDDQMTELQEQVIEPAERFAQNEIPSPPDGDYNAPY